MIAAPTKRGHHSSSKAAQLGRHLLLAAFAPNRSRQNSKEREVEPAGTQAEHRTGRIEVECPLSENAWDERLRDLARTLHGGNLFIAGRQRLRHFQVDSGVPGDVSHDAAQTGFDHLMQVIRDELLQQSVSLSAACQSCVVEQRQGTAGEHQGPEQCIDVEEPIHPGALREVARQVAAHTSVSPGMQAAVETGMPPGLWQPMYVICIGSAQIRVVTFAFIGGPAIGDRPDTKRTPFVLRLTTSDLMHAASTATSGADQPKTSPAWYTVEPTASNAHLILDHVTDLEEELFRAMETGDWGLLSGATMDACRLKNIQSRSSPPSSRESSRRVSCSSSFAGVLI